MRHRIKKIGSGETENVDPFAAILTKPLGKLKAGVKDGKVVIQNRDTYIVLRHNVHENSSIHLHL